MSPEQPRYDIASFDFGRLQKFAQRVARESTQPKRASFGSVPPHWQLNHTTHWIEEGSRGGTVKEYNEQNYWLLADDGRLLYVWKWEDFVRHGPIGTGTLTNGLEVNAMSRELALDLDYTFPNYERRISGARVWGNRVRGRRVRHAPGVGLSLTLKQVLEGRV